MRFSAQLIAGLALIAGTANAGLYRRGDDVSASSEVTTAPTEAATITSPSATSTGGATPVMKHDSAATETNTSATPESHISAFSSEAAPPAQTSAPLIKGSAAAPSAAASSSAAAAAAGSSTAARPKATGSGDYVGFVDHSGESSSTSSGGSHTSGSSSSSSGSGSGSSGSDNGGAKAKPTSSLHTSPGSNLVVPGLAALGSLAVGLMVLV